MACAWFSYSCNLPNLKECCRTPQEGVVTIEESLNTDYSSIAQAKSSEGAVDTTWLELQDNADRVALQSDAFEEAIANDKLGCSSKPASGQLQSGYGQPGPEVAGKSWRGEVAEEKPSFLMKVQDDSSVANANVTLDEVAGAKFSGKEGALTLFCGTMNAGNAKINNVGLWIPPLGIIPPELGGTSGSNKAFDLLAIGLQEASWGKDGKSKNPSMEERDSDDEDDPELLKNPSNELSQIPSNVFASGTSEGSCLSPNPEATSPVPEGGKSKMGLGSKSTTSTAQAGSKSQKAKRQSKSGRSMYVDEVLQIFVRHLGEEYELVECMHRQQMRVMVFAHKSVADEVSDVEMVAENTGVAHVGANKGGQLVKFNLGHTVLCFFSAHLAAHQGQTKRRNADVKEIFAGCRVMDKRLEASTQAHHAFFFGDMNYRIEAMPSAIQDNNNAKKKHQEQFKHVERLVEQRSWSELIATDQLGLAMKEGKVLGGFQALIPNFPPTFKVDRGVVGPKYQEKRIPSWTDRILFRSLPGFKGRLQELGPFQACNGVTSSDHKPVRAAFTLMPSLAPPEVCSEDQGAIIEISRLSCKGLKSMDKGGKSDPYIKCSTVPATAYKGKDKTNTIMSTLDPVWDKPLSLKLNVAKVNNVHLIIECWDYDRGKKDDFIGYVVVHLGDATTKPLDLSDELLLCNGTVHGYLTGRITLQRPV